jgi:hypothetical protein
MEWINDLKDKFSKRRIRSLDRTKEYGRDFIDIESANLIGMIVNLDDSSPDDLKLIEQYIEAIKKRGKRVLVIELTSDKKTDSHFKQGVESVLIGPTKVNWLDYPTPNIESQVRKYEMDILMDFDRSPRMASKYLCSMARAKTRTGVHREGLESCYELMINRGDGPLEEGEEEPLIDMKSMIKEFDYFLNMIDNGSRVKVK